MDNLTLFTGYISVLEIQWFLNPVGPEGQWRLLIRLLLLNKGHLLQLHSNLLLAWHTLAFNAVFSTKNEDWVSAVKLHLFHV